MIENVEQRIRMRLEEHFKPAFLTVVNDSARHAGHAGDNGTGESHFTVTIVSNLFTGISRPARQRLVYDLFKKELADGIIHALSIVCKDVSEYDRVY